MVQALPGGPEVKLPSSATTLWVPSISTHVTRWPGLMVTVLGTNSKLRTSTTACDTSGNSGWTAQTPWTRVNGATGNSSYVWATPNYGDNLSASLSRTLDLSGYSGSTLSFDDRCDTEATYDFGRVEISVNGGGNWTTLYQCDGRTTWQHNRIALPASTDNLADLRLRFRLTSDINTNRPGGWAIDNIVVESGGAQCRADQLDRIFADGFE